jgi:hypothetical protein
MNPLRPERRRQRVDRVMLPASPINRVAAESRLATVTNNSDLRRSRLGLVLTNSQLAIAQREAFVWIVGDRHVKRGMADRHAGPSRDDPADMLFAAVSHFDAKLPARVGRCCPAPCLLEARQALDPLQLRFRYFFFLLPLFLIALAVPELDVALAPMRMASLFGTGALAAHKPNTGSKS